MYTEICSDMKAIKNYRSSIEISKIFEHLQQVLVKHGAKQITFDYGTDGKIYGVMFLIEVPGRVLSVRLPARVENVHAILEKQHKAGLIRRKLDQEQAYRVAWRNILDWVVAQMTLLDIEMVKLEEVFLPYVVNPQGKTLFEVFESYQFQLPLSPEE
jgi:hypothetical protein